MMTKMITKSGTIRASHAVREAFAGCSTYYNTKGDAVGVYSDTLAEYGLYFDPADMICMLGDTGRIHIDIYTGEFECARLVGSATLMWYKMDQSGRWEFTGYLT